MRDGCTSALDAPDRSPEGAVHIPDIPEVVGGRRSGRSSSNTLPRRALVMETVITGTMRTNPALIPLLGVGGVVDPKANGSPSTATRTAGFHFHDPTTSRARSLQPSNLTNQGSPPYVLA